MGVAAEIRETLEDRARARAGYHRHKDRVEELRERYQGERNVLDRLRSRRDIWVRDLRHEIERDERDAGREDDEWEERQRDRLDIVADEIDATQAHIDRVLERMIRHRDLRQEFAKEIKRETDRLDRLRERRRRLAQSSGQLSPHFHAAEFACRDGTPMPDASTEAAKSWARNIGEVERAHFGASFWITSAYRTRTYNASIGGATMSIHVYDGPWQHAPWAVAVDGGVVGVSPATLANYGDGLAAVDGLGRYGSFTHQDNRQRIGWAEAEWIGP